LFQECCRDHRKWHTLEKCVLLYKSCVDPTGDTGFLYCWCFMSGPRASPLTALGISNRGPKTVYKEKLNSTASDQRILWNYLHQSLFRIGNVTCSLEGCSCISKWSPKILRKWTLETLFSRICTILRETKRVDLALCNPTKTQWVFCPQKCAVIVYWGGKRMLLKMSKVKR
jgi:hypothetical protein